MMTSRNLKVFFLINFNTEKENFCRNRSLQGDRPTLNFNHVRMTKRHSASILRWEASVARVKFIKNLKWKTLSSTKVLTCQVSMAALSITLTTIILTTKMSSMICHPWIFPTSSSNFTSANNRRWWLVLQTYPSIRTWLNSMNKLTIRSKKLNFNLKLRHLKGHFKVSNKIKLRLKTLLLRRITGIIIQWSTKCITHLTNSLSNQNKSRILCLCLVKLLARLIYQRYLRFLIRDLRLTKNRQMRACSSSNQ